jgi:hypothetical protein
MAKFERRVESPHGSQKGVEKEVNPRETGSNIRQGDGLSVNRYCEI